MSNLAVLTFAVSSVDVAAYNNGGAVTTWYNLPVVAESTVEYTKQKSEVPDGEGNLIHIWRHSPRARMNLRMKRFAFRILELVTGSPVSSAQGADMIYAGTSVEVNPPYVRLRAYAQAIDQNGTTGYLKVTIFKAQGVMPGVTMRETTPGEFQIEFDALLSSTDENGNTLGSNAYYKVEALKSNTST
jgi:hypothetical protein